MTGLRDHKAAELRTSGARMAPHQTRTETQEPRSATVGIARVAVVAEGEYDVTVPEAGRRLADLLDGLGLGTRESQAYLDGRPVEADALVKPSNQVDLIPLIRGG